MNLELLIKEHEGFRAEPYDDMGDVSIGYGRNLSQVGLSEEEATYLLRNDLKRVRRAIQDRFGLDGLGSARQAVLISMGYNLGIGGLFSFKKMWAAIERADWDGAAREMLDSKWAGQVKGRAVELSEMMRNGEWKA
jgi:lysozyme